MLEKKKIYISGFVEHLVAVPRAGSFLVMGLANLKIVPA